MPTDETEIKSTTDANWVRNAKLSGMEESSLRRLAKNGRLVAVAPSAADVPGAWSISPGSGVWGVLRDYDWVFSPKGEILKTPNHVAVDGRGGAITVDPDAAPDLPSVDPHEHDDGWSVAARLTGADVEALRQAAEHIGDGAVLVGGRAGDHVVGWMDRGEYSSEAKWVFDAKTAQMLKGPGDGLLLQPEWVEPSAPEANDWVVCDYCGIMWGTTWTLGGDKVCTSDKHDHRPATLAERARYPFGGEMGEPYGGPHSTQSEKATVAEVERARSVLLRRIIDGDGLDVDEVETLAKAYDLLR